MALNANNFNQGVNDKVAERLLDGAALDTVMSEHGLKTYFESIIGLCNQEVIQPVAKDAAARRTTFASVGTTGTAQRINPINLTAQPDIARTINIKSSSASQTGSFTIYYRDIRNCQRNYTGTFNGVTAVEPLVAIKTIDYITYTGVEGETITINMGYYMGFWLPPLKDFYSMIDPRVSTDYTGASDTSFSFTASSGGWTATGAAVSIPDRGSAYADDISRYVWRPATAIAMDGTNSYRLLYPVGMADMKFINNVHA